jgi:hypothetical protein
MADQGSGGGAQQNPSKPPPPKKLELINVPAKTIKKSKDKPPAQPKPKPTKQG